MRALICGITGQDGAYLAQLLLGKGYEVWGTSRDSQVARLDNLEYLGIKNDVRVISMAPKDFRSVLTALNQSNPDELYNLAGQSSVGLSFDQPAETIESITMGVLNILEAVRFRKKTVKLYNAGSSECFGSISEPAHEDSPFQPRSPYAVAKASAYWLIANYREAYGLFACNGILFNHESPLRPARFVTRKIISTVHRIARGSKEELRLGRLDIVRDWGWAPEYIEAMWLMLQQNKPDDYIIATGVSHSLEEFVCAAFDEVGLNWSEYVISDPALHRPTDIALSMGNPAKARNKLGWEAKKKMRDIVTMMSDAERNQIANSN